MLPSAIAAIGLVGKILTITCLREGGSVATKACGRAKLAPKPGSTSKAKNKAREIAIAVVTRYKDKVFIVMVPI